MIEYKGSCCDNTFVRCIYVCYPQDGSKCAKDARSKQRHDCVFVFVCSAVVCRCAVYRLATDMQKAKAKANARNARSVTVVPRVLTVTDAFLSFLPAMSAQILIFLYLKRNSERREEKRREERERETSATLGAVGG